MILLFLPQIWHPLMALARLMHKLRRCTAGVVAVVTAMSMPLLLGFTSLGVEVGHWYLVQREMQGAADAAAISAAVEYVNNINSTSYQGVGVQYAALNGFPIPANNVCLYGNNCSTVQALDARPISCPAGSDGTSWACIVVEITQGTMNWATTRHSVMPAAPPSPCPTFPRCGLSIQSIPTPILKARAVVAIKIVTTGPTTTAGANCILAKANDPQAVYVENNNNLIADCGIAIDGGSSGGIAFKNPADMAHVTSLTTNSTNGAPQCPPTGPTRCFVYGTATPLIVTQPKATPDPYTSALNFTNPLGASSATFTAGSGGYTGSSCTFTVTGGTLFVSGTLFDTSNPSQPTKLQASIKNGKVNGIQVIDPGAYATGGFPSLTGSINCNGGSTATYTLTQGCWTQGTTLIAGRTYCSLSIDGPVPSGNYYISNGGNLTLADPVSGDLGTTFFLTNGGIAKLNGNHNPKLCAPGTIASGHHCGDGLNADYTTNQTCNAALGSCFLFIQKSNRGATTVNIIQGSAIPIFSGLIYLPNETLQITGNGNIGGCFGVVAQYIALMGSTTFSNGCLPGDGIGGTTTPGTVTASAPYLFQ